MKLKNKKKELFFEPLSDKRMKTVKGGATKLPSTVFLKVSSNKN